MLLMIVVGFSLFMLWGAGAFTRYGETVTAVITKIEREDDHGYHSAGDSAGWGANRKLWRIHMQYMKDGSTYLAVSDRKYSHTDMFPGEQVSLRLYQGDWSKGKIVGCKYD